MARGQWLRINRLEFIPDKSEAKLVRSPGAFSKAPSTFIEDVILITTE